VRGRRGIYMGWVGRRNLGDEAIFHVCEDRFSQIRWAPLESLTYSVNVAEFASRGARDKSYIWKALAEELRTQKRTRAYAHKLSHRLDSVIAGEVGILGGGTIMNRAGAESYLRVRKQTGRLVPVFGTGVAQPHFWSRIPGWVDRRKEWAVALNELPVIGVRGPNSKALLIDAGARNVMVCGDPAIMFHHHFRNGGRISERGAKLRIAINAGDCSGFLWGNLEAVQVAFSALARALTDDGHEVRLVPIWPKDVKACIDVAKRAALPDDVVMAVMDQEVPFLQAMKEFDLMVALKLHAGILAAAANLPFILLEYQPKALDFAASIGCEELTIRTDEVTPEKLLEKVRKLMDELPQTRETISRQMGLMADRFEDYCRQIEPLLYR
jgi:hypothetical protein